MQEMDKPSGVKAGRLTVRCGAVCRAAVRSPNPLRQLKPAPQLGIFNKGKASVRTKVGKTSALNAFYQVRNAR